MSQLTWVKRCYVASWGRRRLFVPVFIALRLAAYAVIAPLLGLMINLGVSLSSQGALTDQDIAKFLFTPTGFVVSILILGILLLNEVLSLGVMTAVVRAQEAKVSRALRSGLIAVFGRYRQLVIFATLLVLRILFIVVPFALACVLVAGLFLSEFDINYYLTYRPAEFFKAAALIIPLLLVMMALLLSQLSAWALALHFVVFGETSARGAFGKSAKIMNGQRMKLVREIVIWAAIRFGLAALVALVFGALIGFVPINPEGGLRVALLLVITLAGIWMLFGLVVSAISLGALAKILNSFFGQTGQDLPAVDQEPAFHMNMKGVLLGVAVLVAAGFFTGASLLDRVSTTDEVKIIAHRGAAGSRPENTMASIQKALDDGADWVEIDVQETAEGDIVVVHDSDFMKLAGVDLKVWDSTLADLQGIDIGSWFDPAYADQRTPLLRDVLELAKGKSKVLIELKYYGHDVALEERVARIVEETGMQDQIAIMSLKYPAIQKMQALRPEWRTGVLAASAVGNTAKLDGDFLAISKSFASAGLIRATQAAGKDVYVWTINDPLEMSVMISKGVDGLITDEPALVHKVLAFRAELSTAERLLLWMSQWLGLDLSAKEYRDANP